VSAKASINEAVAGTNEMDVPQVRAIVRHIVMNLLPLNTSRKASLKSKRMLAAATDQFRAGLSGL
jgi:hypothetical protein